MRLECNEGWKGRLYDNDDDDAYFPEMDTCNVTHLITIHQHQEQNTTPTPIGFPTRATDEIEMENLYNTPVYIQWVENGFNYILYDMKEENSV